VGGFYGPDTYIRISIKAAKLSGLHGRTNSHCRWEKAGCRKCMVKEPTELTYLGCKHSVELQLLLLRFSQELLWPARGDYPWRICISWERKFANNMPRSLVEKRLILRSKSNSRGPRLAFLQSINC
jgi:hypothetical protein